MNSLRFSGSAWPQTCSALTVVPRMTNMSTPASTTVLANSLVRWGLRLPRDGDAGVAHLPDPLGDQLGLDRLRCRSPASARTASGSAGRRPRRAAARVVVARPEALEVEHAQAAELPEGDRGRRRHHRVHRRREDRQVEPVGVDLPGGRDLLGVTGAPARHDRDVVEGVRLAAALGAADLDLSHPGVFQIRVLVRSRYITSRSAYCPGRQAEGAGHHARRSRSRATRHRRTAEVLVETRR